MTALQQLTPLQVAQVSGGNDFFTAAGAGGSLGGLLATNSLSGAAAGGALGVAAAAAFSIGYYGATALGAGTLGAALGDWLYDVISE